MIQALQTKVTLLKSKGNVQAQPDGNDEAAKVTELEDDGSHQEHQEDLQKVSLLEGEDRELVAVGFICSFFPNFLKTKFVAWSHC